MGAGTDKVKGRIKEAVGDATGNRSMQREGKVDQVAGDLKHKANHAVDRVRDALRPTDRARPRSRA